MLWGGSRSTKPCVLPCKVAAGDDARYLVCATGAVWIVSSSIGSSYVSCKNGCSCVRNSMRFLTLWWQIALEWLHECCMGYVVGRKPEHETLCFSVWSGCRRRWKVPRVCDGCGLDRFEFNRFLLWVLQRVVVPVCVVLCVSWRCGGRSHWNGCMNVAWAMLWGGSRSTKPCVFPCKVAAGDDARYLVCATGAVWIVSSSIGSSYVSCKNGCSCVRNSMRFLTLWWQIALEWLHECCMGYVVGRKPEHETLCFSV